jgi:dipeptide/tripeptide permease
MNINWLVVLGTALIPMIIGFIWYHPKVVGTAWMEAAGMTEEKIKNGNMPLIFGASFIMAFFLAIQMNFVVVHQNHFMSILMNEPGLMEPGSDMYIYAQDFLEIRSKLQNL